jgi:7,8-dihydropterin-6-yl-methyl-4-(beta-D-ribofuranosyl)aminobenzene 5'-phosphate synthase
MRLTVLVDNNTFISRYFSGEPAVSFLIEDRATRVLLDVGYSELFLRNAQKLGLDLYDLDAVVLSHGHLDHSWGLGPLVRHYTMTVFEGRPSPRPRLVAHPGVFASKTLADIPEIGILIDAGKLERHFELQLSAAPIWLTDRLVFLGEIERRFDFEPMDSLGQVLTEAGAAPDFLRDDSGLAYRSDEGLVVIVGCAHSGVCNIIEHARVVCGETRVRDVVGGLHLLDPPGERLYKTVEYLRGLQLKQMHPCHCTSLKSKIVLAGAVPIREVGVGLRIEYGN